MKTTLFLTALLIPAMLTAADRDSCRFGDDGCHISPFRPQITYNDDVAISIDHGDVLIYEKGNEDECVEITSGNRLYVRDKLVKTDGKQQELTRAFREKAIDIRREAGRIGIEGAKIGVDGAKIGIKAVVGVFKLILPDYDSDDLDREMDEESDNIEAKAEVIEKKAQALEETAKDLERVQKEMKEAIPALGELSWF
jgi:hypothetical protein